MSKRPPRVLTIPLALAPAALVLTVLMTVIPPQGDGASLTFIEVVAYVAIFGVTTLVAIGSEYVIEQAYQHFWPKE